MFVFVFILWIFLALINVFLLLPFVIHVVGDDELSLDLDIMTMINVISALVSPVVFCVYLVVILAYYLYSGAYKLTIKINNIQTKLGKRYSEKFKA